MQEHSDRLFLAGDDKVFSIGMSDSIWKYPNKKRKWNLIGNWEIFGVPSNLLVKSYGYDDYENIFKQSLNSKNIYIITSQADVFLETYGMYILSLYKQCYGILPSFRLVDNIRQIPSLNESLPDEYWAVYRLEKK